ncbi:MAG: alkaline phosphatase family protein, partial [Xanthomonadales bacterium]|nr:alkaline phosphatase family protein [Xanthomonadales bacterium]
MSRFWLLALGACLFSPTAVAVEGEPEIRLVLQITVDGLRPDLISRGAGHFEEGGFKYLLDNGAVFAN